MGAALEIGTVVANKYRLEREIGSGGMGVVFAATHIHLEQRVALKFLHAHSQTPETVERFYREARAAVKIQSEHVARVLDIGDLDGGPYIVMEYLEGDDLENVVKNAGPLPVDDAVRYLLQTCEALAEVHALGMVHRDIKPANLFLAARADGTPIVKLLDFGISKQGWEQDAKDAKLSGGGRLTQTSAVIGSPRYMSPEQLRSSRDVDVRTDVWSLGVTLFEMLGGDSPFASGTMPEVCASILKDAPISLVGLRPDVPIELENVIHRCLAKKPAERWSNVGELAMALRPFGPTASTTRSIERVAGVLHQNAVRGSMAEAGRGLGSTPPPISSTQPRVKTVDRPLGVSHAMIPQPPIIPADASAPRSSGSSDTGRTDASGHVSMMPTEHQIAMPRAATSLHDARTDEALEAHYMQQLGDASSMPHRIVDMSKLASISSLNLDHRAGFLISMMDGTSSIDDLLMLSGMSRLETLKLIVDLVTHKVITLVPSRRRRS